MKILPTLVALIILALTSACTTPGVPRESKQSASIVDYLYPASSDAPKMEPGIARLRPPVRVGLAFVPADIKARTLPEAEKLKLLERTKAALSAARARGTRLGNPRLDEAAKRGTAALKANARRFAANVLPIIREIEKAGAASFNAIATKLNERDVPTARGGRWTHVQVGAVLRPFADGAASAVV